MNRVDFTSEQKQAIENAAGDMMITAAAGAGKTFVLTEIVSHLIEERGIDPQQIVVITFTEKAAYELKERLARRLGQTLGFFEDCPIGTIHAFAARLLRERPDSHLRNFVIWEGHRASLESSRLVHEELRRLLLAPSEGLAALFEEYGWRVLVSLMGRLLAMRWKMRAVADRAVTEPLWPVLQDLYDHMRQQYVAHKRRHGAYDFEDLEEEALALLSQGEVCRRLQDHYRHILVDEYQDISPPQYDMIQRLHRVGTNRLIAVGDPLQSIYRFRGADVSLFEKTQRAMQGAGAASVELRTNFRTQRSLIDDLNPIFQSLFGGQYQDMRAAKAGQGGPSLTQVALPKSRSLSASRQTEATLIIGQIETALKAGHQVSDFAILFRSRAAMGDYESALDDAQIPFVSQSGDLLFDQPEILDQLNALRALSRPEDTIALAGVMLSPLGGLTDRALWACRGKELQKCLSQHLSELTPTEKKSWDGFTRWWNALCAEAPYLKTSEIAERLFQRARSRNYYGEGPERASLRQWIEFLRWMELIDPFEVEDLVSVIEGYRQDRARIYKVDSEAQPNEGVQLMTIHSAKGLEFPVVILADLSAAIPSQRDPILIDSDAGIGMRRLDSESRGLRDQMLDTDEYLRVKEEMRAEDLAESRRLLYVACTRARDSLILPLDRHRREKQPTWNKWLCEALSEK